MPRIKETGKLSIRSFDNFTFEEFTTYTRGGCGLANIQRNIILVQTELATTDCICIRSVFVFYVFGKYK